MAKAQFQKGQKVWVECVGAWAVVEKVQPVWAKGFDEPVRISYDVGFGREFLADELEAERGDDAPSAAKAGEWRMLRAKNKWQQPEECGHHPYPGSYPVVVTDPNDWGGWRVPGAEYDRDPHKIEFQARLIGASPKLMRLAEELAEAVADAPHDAPPEMVRLARAADAILRMVKDHNAPPRREGPAATAAAAAAAAAPVEAPGPVPTAGSARPMRNLAPDAKAQAPIIDAEPARPKAEPTVLEPDKPKESEAADRLRARLMRFTG
ncbi:hypothetical protein [Caulobacter sp. 17J80-11]|uniref:hypothetical protein n=1 Tax=Caulobacter sp. 17J80-11 TaxID=2763502 RepID=UPI00351C3CCE